MERDGVLRALRVDAGRVVRTVNVQRHHVQRHDRHDDERQQVVQREEAVERRVVDGEAAPQPGDDRFADDRDGREQVGDDGGAPEAHLAPRQHVTHEGRRHHQQEDDHAQDPQQFARRLVGAVVHAAEDMDVDGDEEERRAVHVQVADQPALRHVTVDALDGVEGHQHVRRVVGREHDAGGDHEDQHHRGDRAEGPEIVEIPWRRERVIFLLDIREDRQAVIDPGDHLVIEDRRRAV